MRISNRSLIAAVGLLLALSVAALALIAHRRGPAVRACVTVDGAAYGSYPLDTDAVIPITPPDGSWYNTLVIERGRAFIRAADCPTQTCVHTPALTADTTGVIVCLPHGVVVTLGE